MSRDITYTRKFWFTKWFYFLYIIMILVYVENIFHTFLILENRIAVLAVGNFSGLDRGIASSDDALYLLSSPGSMTAPGFDMRKKTVSRKHDPVCLHTLC